MKNIAILGSTGSIGTQTLEIVRANKDIRVTALSCGQNIEKLETQCREFRPKLAAVFDEQAAKTLSTRLADMPVKVCCGMDGLIAAAEEESSEILVTAIVGMIGILPTICAIEAGKHIALANKETLVTAGHIIMPLAAEKGVMILPVDSEHSAIFQVLNGQDRGALSKILLTCSGGPFRGKTLKELSLVTPKEALKHPNWNMGHKITIDSATLANKGLEVMEARWLFGVEIEDIKVVIQPKSIIHSMVEFTDGAVLAQLGTPDMKLPIQYALYYPERRHLAGDRLDFTKIKEITFDVPDMINFPALSLALCAGREGGSLPTVFNAANEWAVARFLESEIKFTQIAECICAAMDSHKVISNPSLDDILETEKETRQFLKGEFQ